MQHIICLYGGETQEWAKRDVSQSQAKKKFLCSIKKQTEGIDY
jgi:hypothetical protein